MASSKRIRKGTSRGFETIVLKDLQCLHKWNVAQLETYKPKRSLTSAKLNDCDHLLCNETLDDLDDVWATPKKPKRSKKSRLKVKKQSSPQASTVSPDSSWVVPPNSPAEAAHGHLATSNPYITYLMHTWDGARATPPKAGASNSENISPVNAVSVTTLRKSPAAADTTEDNQVKINPESTGEATSTPTSSQSREHSLLRLNPRDDLETPNSVSEELNSSVHSSQSQYDGLLLLNPSDILSIPDTSGRRLHVPLHSSSTQDDNLIALESEDVLVSPALEDNRAASDPEDLLVIPDITREELATLPHSSQSQEEDEQLVPGEETSDHSLQASQSLSEDSLFVEDGFMPPEPCQQTPCQQDHRVPEFQLEE